LLRWEHPEYGLTRPEGFLEVATELGLMPKIGGWSLREACRQLTVWHAEFPRIRPLTMSVNFSLRHFANADLPALVNEVLLATGVDASSLKLEITESDTMQHPEAVTAVLKQLELQQIETCLDDFGTGYSSLSYLQQLPIMFLKIDQSFVREVTNDATDAAIVSAVIAMAHSLDLKVIAEGVETEEQLAYLQKQRCDRIQGYLFSAPLAADDLENYLLERKSAIAAAR